MFFLQINVELLVKKIRYLYGFRLLLYINRNLTLPSLCKALHNDGWGEGFEQHSITLGDDEVYISFWNSDDDYFLKIESEVFLEQKFEQTMGGLN